MAENFEQELKDRETLLDIDRQAGSIEAEITDNVPSSVLDDIISRLRTLQSTTPISAAESAAVNGKIGAIEQKAKQAKAEAQAEEAKEAADMIAAATGGSLMAASAADIAFSNQMLQYMTQNEQQFFNSLQGPQSLVMLDENGEIIRTQDGSARVEAVNGNLLQTDFALIKYHSLDKAEQEKIGEPPEGRRSVADLHDSLTRLEGLHIKRRMEKGIDLETAYEASHNDFARTHDQVNSTFAVEATAKALEVAAKANPVLAMNAKVAGIAAKYHHDKLEQDLKTVIGELTEDNHQPNRAHTQGVDVVAPSSPQHTGGVRTASPEQSR